MTYIEASNNQWKQEDKNEARKKTTSQAIKLPTSYLKEGLNKWRKARSKPRPTYPRAHKWEEAVPILLLHYELQQASKKEKKRTKMLENEKGGWEIATKPLGGPFSVVWMSLGQPRLLSTRSDTCKTSKVSLARKATQNYTNLEKLCLFRAKFFFRNFMKKI